MTRVGLPTTSRPEREVIEGRAFVFLLVVNLCSLLVVGCFIETSAAIPRPRADPLRPIAMAHGVDPLHFET